MNIFHLNILRIGGFTVEMYFSYLDPLIHLVADCEPTCAGFG
jgi:hypothetical protein